MKRDDRVLLVENNPALAETIEACFTCDRAADGWEAIAKLETEQYAAIVIDTDVPRQSGFGVLTYLHEEVGTDLPNVIVMTSADTDEVRRKTSPGLKVVNKTDVMAELHRVLGVEQA
jgi:DNA-binding response OmpR family regulator